MERKEKKYPISYFTKWREKRKNNLFFTLQNGEKREKLFYFLLYKMERKEKKYLIFYFELYLVFGHKQEDDIGLLE
jgi:hypothetical protein